MQYLPKELFATILQNLQNTSALACVCGQFYLALVADAKHTALLKMLSAPGDIHRKIAVAGTPAQLFSGEFGASADKIPGYDMILAGNYELARYINVSDNDTYKAMQNSTSPNIALAIVMMRKTGDFEKYLSTVDSFEAAVVSLIKYGIRRTMDATITYNNTFAAYLCLRLGCLLQDNILVPRRERILLSGVPSFGLKWHIVNGHVVIYKNILQEDTWMMAFIIGGGKIPQYDSLIEKISEFTARL